MTIPAYALDPAEVQVGTANGPGLYVAPVGTPPPPDTSSEWPAPWEIAGYLADSGPVIGSATTTQDIKPWQSRSPIRTVITERTMSVQFIMWQINALTTAIYFDSDPITPAADGSFTTEVRSDTDQHQWAVGVDTSDSGRAMRVCFHRTTLSAAANMTIAAGAAVPLDVTMTALDDAGVLADVLVGPSGSGTGGTNHVTVTNPGTQSTVVDVPVTPALAMQGSTSGSGAVTYTAAGLPAGLAINPATGAITGTPTTVESANVTVTATDDTLATGSCTFTWDITATTVTRGSRS